EDVNHEIYGGIYSQMIFGESFQEPALSPALTGFKSHAGRWLVNDGVVQVKAEDGPKLVSERAAFKDGAVGVELKFADRKAGHAGVIVRGGQTRGRAERVIGHGGAARPRRKTTRVRPPSQQFRADQECALRCAGRSLGLPRGEIIRGSARNRGGWQVRAAA